MIGWKSALAAKNDRWNRTYTYDKKRTNSLREEACSKADISYS